MVALIGIALALIAAAWLLHQAILADRMPRLFIEPWSVGPYEPCWTEEIGRSGGLSYARSQCVNDALMEMDSRAARGDFPMPGSGG